MASTPGSQRLAPHYSTFRRAFQDVTRPNNDDTILQATSQSNMSLPPDPQDRHPFDMRSCAPLEQFDMSRDYHDTNLPALHTEGNFYGDRPDVASPLGRLGSHIPSSFESTYSIAHITTVQAGDYLYSGHATVETAVNHHDYSRPNNIQHIFDVQGQTPPAREGTNLSIACFEHNIYRGNQNVEENINYSYDLFPNSFQHRLENDGNADSAYNCVHPPTDGNNFYQGYGNPGLPIIHNHHNLPAALQESEIAFIGQVTSFNGAQPLAADIGDRPHGSFDGAPFQADLDAPPFFDTTEQGFRGEIGDFLQHGSVRVHESEIGDPPAEYQETATPPNSHQYSILPDTTEQLVADNAHTSFSHRAATSYASDTKELADHEAASSAEVVADSGISAAEELTIQPIAASSNLGHDEQGDLWVRIGDEGPWLPAHRHVDIRQRLLNDADQQGTYDVLRAHGKGHLDYTSFLHSQKTWGVDRARRPPWSFVFAEPPNRPTFKDAVRPMWRYGRVVIGIDDIPIKDYPDIPDTISSQIEGYVMEEVSRKDKRVKKEDWRARMLPLTIAAKGNPVVPPVGNTLSARMRRFRNRACLYVWDLPRDGSAQDRAFMNAKLPAACKAANSTRGFRDLFEHELVEKELQTFGQYTSRAGNRKLPQNERDRRHQALSTKYDQLLKAHLKSERQVDSPNGTTQTENDLLGGSEQTGHDSLYDGELAHNKVGYTGPGEASTKRKRSDEEDELYDPDNSLPSGFRAPKRAKVSATQLNNRAEGPGVRIYPEVSLGRSRGLKPNAQTASPTLSEPFPFPSVVDPFGI